MSETNNTTTSTEMNKTLPTKLVSIFSQDDSTTRIDESESSNHKTYLENQNSINKDAMFNKVSLKSIIFVI